MSGEWCDYNGNNTSPDNSNHNFSSGTWTRGNVCRFCVVICTRFILSRSMDITLRRADLIRRSGFGDRILGEWSYHHFDICAKSHHLLCSECLALLQGHTALVCQLQLSGDTLATGGSDGRVITFSLSSMSSLRRIAAHDSSVTALQFDAHFLVTAGNDGRVRLFDASSGAFIRDLTAPADSVWKVAHKKDKCVVMCRRAGKTVMEIWSFRPSEEDD